MSYHHVSAMASITDSLTQELVSGGWVETQLRHDALQVWVHGDEIFFSLGDWAKVSSDDVEAAIKRVFGDDVHVEWDFEAGPGEGKWEQIF